MVEAVGVGANEDVNQESVALVPAEYASIVLALSDDRCVLMFEVYSLVVRQLESTHRCWT